MKQEIREQLEIFLNRIDAENRSHSQGYFGKKWSLMLCTWNENWTEDETWAFVLDLYQIIEQTMEHMKKENVPIEERRRFIEQIRELADDMEEELEPFYDIEEQLP